MSPVSSAALALSRHRPPCLGTLGLQRRTPPSKRVHACRVEISISADKERLFIGNVHLVCPHHKLLDLIGSWNARERWTANAPSSACKPHVQLRVHAPCAGPGCRPRMQALRASPACKPRVQTACALSTCKGRVLSSPLFNGFGPPRPYLRLQPRLHSFVCPLHSRSMPLDSR